jgi:hypothetical protein
MITQTWHTAVLSMLGSVGMHRPVVRISERRREP